VYRRWLSARRRPDIQRLVDDLRTQVDAVNNRWATERGGGQAGAGPGRAATGPEPATRAAAAAMPEVSRPPPEAVTIRYGRLPIAPTPLPGAHAPQQPPAGAPSSGCVRPGPMPSDGYVV